MIDVQEISRLHQRTVAAWHEQEISDPYSGLLSIVCQQHSFNFRLWHQEDIARSTVADDSIIADVKRKIDKFNQQRNDWIEKIDDCLTRLIHERGVQTESAAPINTETPGSVIDRLSILELRIYHMREQLDREDVDKNHCQSVSQKLALCLLQQDELLGALQKLLNDIGAGSVRHRTYRQMKMYNDPALNPFLYNSDTNETADPAIAAGGRAA
ncbi:MAG: DUF4254 domain-containing protein [Pirellulaceae bacterium]